MDINCLCIVGIEDFGVFDDVILLFEEGEDNLFFYGVVEEFFCKVFVELIKLFLECEVLVFLFYYDEELNLKEIGEVFGVSEFCVS